MVEKGESGKADSVERFKITDTVGFRITVGTEPTFENPIADIYFNDEIVAVINQESGDNCFVIELWPRRDGSRWQLDLPAFENAIAQAIRRLRHLNSPEIER